MMSAAAVTKRRLTIEDALEWAYREELPKAPRGRLGVQSVSVGRAWAGVEAFGELLALIDDEGINRFGLVVDLTADSLPHDDAITIHEAVAALDALEVALPVDWSPVDDVDLGTEGAACVALALRRLCYAGEGGVLRPRERMSDLVRRCAILGAPDWALPACRRREVTTDAGRTRWFRRIHIVTEGAHGPASFEAEVDGWDPKRKRPYADAYRKLVWDPDPTDAIMQRGRFELWRAALVELADVLAGRLTEVEVLPTSRSSRPWVEPERQRRILPTLLPELADSAPVATRRTKRVKAK